jgi:hypothetical protein
MKAITSAKLNGVSARNSRFAFPKTLRRGFDGDLYRTASQCASFRATFLSPPIVHPGEEEAIIGGSRLRRLVLETSILFTSGRLSKKRRLRVGSRYASAFMVNANEPVLWMQLPASTPVEPQERFIHLHLPHSPGVIPFLYIKVVWDRE